MIKSFKHKGLRLLWEEGKTSKLPAELVSRIERMLEVIDRAAKVPDDFDVFPNWNINKLSGDLKDYWSVKVNKNYRIIFRFDEQHVYDVDYLDYH
ncbi:plasmid maintenance system killer [Sphingobacterium alkalisoli]|uniref:Plasmid maintenance system killer n=1 Tax=Sphingobacterium alkalisoli TaxID=1874115 RepID=A0A4V6WF35_9SPHI|nr:type II toxin-antitoxin system RelE/ParE family toxin [Sphingobacterium alkalisoli]TJY63559.1 plasmid maintenance system killer [Sphingobacterium alkalisoli]GGH26832.1 protein killer protein [Sphingobacterium alkalisoli]